MNNSFDIDGVLYMGEFGGIYPGPSDVIITGRSYEEEPVTRKMLADKGITNPVYFNPLKWVDKSRETSGIHKGNTIKKLREAGIDIRCHFEDDEIQAAEILKIVPDINIIMVVHNLVPKENVWHEL